MARRRKNPYPKLPGLETPERSKTTLTLLAATGAYFYARKYKPEWSTRVLAALTPSTFAYLAVRGGGVQDSSMRLLADAAPYIIGSVAAYLAYDHFSGPTNTALSGPSVQQGLLIGPHTPTL
jgi:hypothetical protein